jgi:hypothetical protein
VDTGEICPHCGPQHREEAISQQLRHFHESSYFLSQDQTKIVDKIVKICKESDLEYEIIDTEDLNFLGRMKLFFKGIKAPTVIFKGKRIEGIPTREDLKAVTDWCS